MSEQEVIGAALMLTGVVDAAIGFLVVIPKANEKAKPTLQLAFLCASLLMMGLGLAGLANMLPFE